MEWLPGDRPEPALTLDSLGDFTHRYAGCQLPFRSLLLLSGRLRTCHRCTGSRGWSGAGGQLAAAVAGGLQGGEEGGADAVVLQFADGVDGGAGRGGDGFAELDRVFPAVAEHDGGTDGGL